jgi:hypothetical protein
VLGQDETHIKQPATLIFTVSGFDLDELFTYLEDHPDQVGVKEDYVSGYGVDFFRSTPGHCFIGLQGLISEARRNGDFDIPRNQFIYISNASPDLLAINTSRVTKIDASDPIDLSDGLLSAYHQVWQLLRFMQKYVPGFRNSRITQISPSLGVRETRHFDGVRRLTANVIGSELDEHTIALSAYNIDIHSGTGDHIDLNVVERPFGIPYECLVTTSVDGLLLSGRTISADTTTYASARVMGPCLAMGEAAGSAASLAVKLGSRVRDVDVEALRTLLTDNGAILETVP